MKLWTCSVCKCVGRHESELDEKRICRRCLHKAIHGDDVYERCKTRGYHETNRSGGGSIYPLECEDGTYFQIEVSCLCGAEVHAFLKSPGPDPDAPGFERFLIPVPNAARYWALVGGEYTPIDPAEIGATHESRA